MLNLYGSAAMPCKTPKVIVPASTFYDGEAKILVKAKTSCHPITFTRTEPGMP